MERGDEPATTAGRVLRGDAAGRGLHPRLALAACVVIAVQRGLLVAMALLRSGGHLALFKWDANRYREIAVNGYVYPPPVDQAQHLLDGPSLAFFPLLPASARVLHTVTGLGIKPALEVAAVGWLPLAAWGIAEVGLAVADRRTGLFLVAMWGAAPRSLVTILPYTEGAYTALAAWSLLAMLRRRWWWAAGLCAVAGVTRSSATVLVACLGLAWVRDRWGELRRPRTLAQGLGLFLVSISGLAAFVGYVGWRTGRWNGYLQVQDDWRMSMGSPLVAASQIPRIWHQHHNWINYQYVVIVVLVALVLALVTLTVQPTWILASYTLISTLWVWMATNYFFAKARFLLPVFPLGLGPARLLARLPVAWGVLATLLLTLTGCVADTIVWMGGGSP